jgi:hypothetical protein
MPKSNEYSKIDPVADSQPAGQNKNLIKPAVFFVTSPSENEDLLPTDTASLPLVTTQEITSFFSWDYLNKIIVNLSRVLLTALVTFEALNALGVLQYHVSFHWIALLLTTGGAWSILELIFSYSRKTNKLLSNILLLAAAAALYADTLGQVFSLFDNIEWYDRMLHFFAGGALCASIIFLLIKSLETRGKIHLGILSSAFFAWTTTLTLGLFYEFGEWLLDTITGSNSLVSLYDTMDDLRLDTFGSLLILTILVIYFYYVSRRSHTADKNPAAETANP